MAQWLDPSVPTVARQLHQAGYATGHFGKWHMGGQRDVAEAPLITQYGFDASLTNFEGLGSRVLPLCDNHDGQPPYRHALGSDTLGRGPIRWMNRSDITAEFVRGAMAFMDDAQKRGKPVYVNLWPDDVHSPFHPPASRQGDGSKRSRYLGVLTNMDEQLGVLFDYVRDNLAWRDDTLILLASDNGPEAGAGVSTPLRGSKGMLYEGGVRSPLIVWGPGLIDRQQRGAMNERSVLCSLDLARSLLALAQVTPPPDALLDGKDLSQTLLGRSVEGRGEPIAWRRPPDRPGDKQSIWPDLAVRDGRWKLLMAYDGSQPQLYDLQADPQEAKDLAAQHPDVVNRLRRWLLEWHGAMPPDAGPALGTQLQNQRPR